MEPPIIKRKTKGKFTDALSKDKVILLNQSPEA